MDINESGVSPKSLQKFITSLLKMAPEEFYGVCIILGISIEDENSDPQNHVLKYKPVDLLLEEAIDKFCFLDRKKRKNLMKIIDKTVKGRK